MPRLSAALAGRAMGNGRRREEKKWENTRQNNMHHMANDNYQHKVQFRTQRKEMTSDGCCCTIQ
jgi:hypothetical protein